MEGAPNTPQKKPNKAIEAVKKVARVLAVGATLAGVPTDVSAMRYGEFRRSTNVEDDRGKKPEPVAMDFSSDLITNNNPVSHWEINKKFTGLNVE